MITFTDSLLIGNGQIDAEHKMLFDMINAAHIQITEQHCSIQNAIELIQNLENYANVHFAHEEEYMKKINDPEYSIQVKEHNIFRDKIQKYSGIAIDSEKDAKEVLDDILTYLAQWLYRHIIGSDSLIGKVPVMAKEEVEDVFAFTSKYQNGIPFIDDEHRNLFALIKKTYDTLNSSDFENDIDCLDTAVDVLDELEEFTKAHFSHEEYYMRSIEYDGLDEQLRAHQAFLYKLEDVHVEIHYGDMREYLEDLVEFLLYWLTNHIGCMDMKIPFVPDKVC